MKRLFVCLLGVALLIGAARSLRCYSCYAALTGTACNTAIDCPSGSEYCVKAEGSVNGVPMFSKGCVPDCTEESISKPGRSGTISCCASDLCNGASSDRISYSLLSLAAGISALVVRAVL